MRVNPRVAPCKNDSFCTKPKDTGVTPPHLGQPPFRGGETLLLVPKQDERKARPRSTLLSMSDPRAFAVPFSPRQRPTTSPGCQATPCPPHGWMDGRTDGWTDGQQQRPAHLPAQHTNTHTHTQTNCALLVKPLPGLSCEGTGHGVTGCNWCH